MRTVVFFMYLACAPVQISYAQEMGTRPILGVGTSISVFKVNTGIIEESIVKNSLIFTSHLQRNDYKYFFAFVNIVNTKVSGKDFTKKIPLDYKINYQDVNMGVGVNTDFIQFAENKNLFSVDLEARFILLPRPMYPEVIVSGRFWTRNRFLRISIFGEGNHYDGFGFGISGKFFFFNIFKKGN